MVNKYILYVYLEIRIQKDLCPIMNCRCNLNTFLRCYVRKVVIKNDNIKLHSACGRLHNGSESYLTEHSIHRLILLLHHLWFVTFQHYVLVTVYLQAVDRATIQFWTLLS